MTKPKKKGAQQTKELTLLDEEMNEESSANFSDSETGPDTAELANESASLQTILQELRDSRRDNGNNFKELKEDLKNITGRLTDAENRIEETEDRTQRLEEVTLELIKAHEKLEAKITDLEGRSRRGNIRLHGISEGSEDNSPSISVFVQTLLTEKLNIPPSLDFTIERAHRSLGSKPPLDAPPRSIVVKFSSFRVKEEILKMAWQMKGFSLNGKRVILDHDYAPEVLKQRREYTEAKRILREKRIKFQTPYPAKLRVFYDGEIRVYNTAAEATEDMAKRGLEVTVIKPPKTLADKITSAMWNKVGRADKEGTDTRTNAGYKRKLEVYRRDLPAKEQTIQRQKRRDD